MATQINSGVTILRRPQVEQRTGLARSTLYERVKNKTFPAPVAIGARAVGWIQEEIDTWLTTQIQNSRKS